MNHQTPQTTQLLRERGLRVTAARHAVLDWLVEHPHATVEQVHDGVAQRIGALSKQAVYDVLVACVDADLVRQIKPAGHPACFERRTGDNHHHLICRGCGRIADVDCLRGEKPCLTPAHNHGFAVDEAEVMFWGLCKPCRHNMTANV
jgi:Fur family ferric uptake transcriptional regulator